jgi:PBP1b-binding outer membrane lipoprotein LpoB
MKNIKTTLAPIVSFLIVLAFLFSSCASVDPAKRYQKAHKDNVFTGYKKHK